MNFKGIFIIFFIFLVAFISLSSSVAIEDKNINESVEGDLSLSDEKYSSDIVGEYNLDDNKLMINYDDNSSLKSGKTIILNAEYGHNEMTDSTIQKAINSASAGDTIIINGTYYVHCHFVVDKKLTIKSNVKTKMETCPGSIAGSNHHGIFYISPKASGTIIEGFNLVNDVLEYDDYAMLVNGASNVIIRNCVIFNTGTNDAIRLENAINANLNNLVVSEAETAVKIKNSNNTTISYCLIKNSDIGINIISSLKTNIFQNNVTGNIITGICVGENNYHTKIISNNISYNKATGINLFSSNNVYIISNYIAHNRNDLGNDGAGVYVNCNVSKIEIKGNFFQQNGLYAVLNDYRVRNIGANVGDEKLEIVENNYMFGHGSRPIYHITYVPSSNGEYNYDSVNDVYNYVGSGGSYDVTMTTIYLGYTYHINEFVCPTILYEYTKNGPKIWVEGNYSLKITEIKEEKKGVYSISIVTPKGDIVKEISSFHVIFYLNKNNTSATPQEGDVYRYVLIKNGTARVRFYTDDFKESNNTLIVSFPGLSNNIYINPYKRLNISDSSIPGVVSKSKITISNLITYPNSGKYLTAILKDETGKAIANKKLILKIASKTHVGYTNNKGEAKFKISIPKEGNYQADVSFAGDDIDYYGSRASSKVIIKKQSSKIIASNFNMIPKMAEYYTITLKDAFGNKLTNQKVTFKVNNKVYNVKTNSKGVAKIKLKFNKQKTYKINIKFAGNNKYKSAQKTNTIKVKYSSKIAKLLTPSITIPPKTTKSYVIILKGINNKGIAKQKINIKLNGKKFTKKTNSKGQAIIKIKFNSQKKYKISASYKGNKIYKKASSSGKINVLKTTTKFITPFTKILPNEEKSYTVTLKTSSGKALAKQKINIKINSKIYTKTTNNKGQASIKIKFNKENTYSVFLNYKGTSIYKSSKATGKITVEKLATQLISYDRTFSKNSKDNYEVTLKDKYGNRLPNQKIIFTLNDQSYLKVTDNNGKAKINISSTSQTSLNILTKYAGNMKYKSLEKHNKITISNKTNTTFIDDKLDNEEIQNILNNCNNGDNVEFLGDSYSNIALTVNKNLNIYSLANSLLNAKLNNPIFKINALNVNITGLKICGNSNSGIVINNANNVSIANNTILNKLNSLNINKYMDGTLNMPGYGIAIYNSSNLKIINNSISFFESGFYGEKSTNIEITNNTFIKNNYGIKYGFGVANTKINANNITQNIGLYIMTIPEGPSGYGIFLNNSAVNVSITKNSITNNHMGISIDANYSTGIVITSNCISDNVLEGIRFNAGYDLANGAIEPIVTNNAIYRNAKGPSMMILGELSANPGGIYGPGVNNDSAKLHIGANWYGTNSLVTWDINTGIVGFGTMCPRIKTSEIKFNEINCTGNGSYEVKFYNNDELASNLPKFNLYATLNRGSDKEVEVNFNVIDGVGRFTFNHENFNLTSNTIEISIGSLINKTDRIYKVFYSYDVSESEIPTI